MVIILLFYWMFNQINTALVSIRDDFQKHKKKMCVYICFKIICITLL